VSGVHGFRDFDYVMGGGALGFDYAFHDRFLAGADFGYASTDVDLDGHRADGNIRSVYGSVYGTAFTERAYVESVLSYGRQRYKNDRAMKIGSIQRQANSRHDGNAFSAVLEGGYGFPVQSWTFQPFASLSYNILDEESVKESGAGALDMRIRSRQTSSLASEVGVRVKRSVAMSKGVLIPEAGAAWQYNFDIDDRRIPTSFSGRPDIGFSIDGRDLGRNRATVDAGVTFVGKGCFSTTIRYNGEFGEKVNAHGVSGQIRFSF
jgi:outer membrane autotransporter protein